MGKGKAAAGTANAGQRATAEKERPAWLKVEKRKGEKVEVGPDDLVYARLEKYPKNGLFYPTSSLANIVTVLDFDRRWAGKVGLNLLAGVVEVHGEPLADHMESEIALWLNTHYQIGAPTPRVHEAIVTVAHRHEYHPVRDYLRSLEWDGVERLDSVPVWCFHSPDLPIYGVMFRRWAISCVARVMNPGCKVDTTLILVGKQGTKKSSVLAAMAGEQWFADSSIQVTSKDAYQQLLGVWVYELGELDSLKRAESSAVKQFLAARRDHYRPSYGRNVVDVPRQVVFVGSTNETEFLIDPTGSRRYFPIPCYGTVDLEAVRTCRDQLWAEALVRYTAHEVWWLEGEENDRLREVSEVYQQTDSWDGYVSDYVSGRYEASIAEIMENGLGISKGDQKRSDQMRVASVLVRLGWEKERRREPGGRSVKWRPPAKLSTGDPPKTSEVWPAEREGTTYAE